MEYKIYDAKPGYSYAPIQKFGEMYSAEEGLKNGTVFPELNLPLGVYGKKEVPAGGEYNGK